MQPARAPARKTAQRGVGASSGMPETCGPGAQVRGTYRHARPGTPAPEGAALRLRCVRDAGGRHAHPVCAAWLR